MTAKNSVLTALSVLMVTLFGIGLMSLSANPLGELFLSSSDDPSDRPTVPTNPDLPPPVVEKEPQLEDTPSDAGRFNPAEPATTGSSAVTVDAALSHPMIHPDGAEKIHAELVFEATDEMPEQRAPLNVALVIDRSGSMRGEPIQRAREAARTFVDALEPQDRISLITFDHEITTDVASIHVDEEGKPLLHHAIDDITAGGATNISDGLRAGFDEITSHSNPDMVDRIVLMTDGIPNRGLTSNEELAAKTADLRRNGVTVSALGFGPDYDPELLANMAVEGAGNFRHITDPGDLEAAFADEYDDLRSTIASGLHVDLIAGDGIQIHDVYGFSQDKIDGGTRITLGNLEADGRRSAVVELAANNHVVDTGELRDIIDVEINYVDRLDNRDHTGELSLNSRVTGSLDDIEETVDDNVMVRVEEHRSLRSLQDIRRAQRRGDHQRARAEIERERRRLDRLRERYDDPDDDGDSGIFGNVRSLFDSAQNEVGSIGAEGASAPAQMDAEAVKVKQGRSGK